MTADLDAAHALYAAFAAHDGAGILAALHDDFRGEVTPGLPFGAGEHHGPRAMFADCWGPVFAALDVAPYPDELLLTEDGRVVALGHYRGTARASGRDLDAVFVHVLRFRDGKVVDLIQITDSQRWIEALAPAVAA